MCVGIEIVTSGAGELGFVTDTDTLCYTIVSVRFFCYSGPECLAVLL
jgi:hypothetical protein